MTLRIRIARPVNDLARASEMYRQGLGFELIERFADHDGFDGVILGVSGAPYQLELTYCRHHPLVPTPTVEDLLVLYLPDGAAWNAACARIERAGFERVEAFNPWWTRAGRTYADMDGYRVVLQQGER